MDNYITRKNKRSLSPLDEDDGDGDGDGDSGDCGVYNGDDNHYKFIFDYDDNDSFISNTDKKLEYSWITQDKLKKKKTKRNKFVQAKKKRKLNGKNHRIDQYFVTVPQHNNHNHNNNNNNHNHTLSLAKKPVSTADQYENVNAIKPTPNSNNNNNNNENIDLWAKQYEPKNVDDIIGNTNGVYKLKAFLNEWKNNIYHLLQSQSQKTPNNIRKNNLFGYYSGESGCRQSRIEYMNKVKKRKNKKTKKIIGNKRHMHRCGYPQYKAALLHGKSGSGKTMTVNLLGLELGFDIICYSSLEFANICVFDNEKLSWNLDYMLKPRLIVIEDGDVILSEKRKLKQIANGIKTTKIPIILIINSYKYSAGLGQLKKSEFCQYIEFLRPKKEMSLIRILDINNLNNTKNNSNFVGRLLDEFDCDLRSCLILLQFWCDTHDISIAKYLANPTPMSPNVLSCILSMKNQLFIEKIENNENNKLWIHKHDEIMDIFESNKRFFNAQINNSSTMHDGINWYFNCSSLTALFIFENYLSIQSSHTSNINDLYALLRASALIADGDLLDTTIQKNKNYKLMPINAVISCWNVSKIICQRFGGINFEHFNRIQFPQWFNQNTKHKTRQQHLNKIRNNKQCRYIIDKMHYLLDYGPYLLLMLLNIVNSPSTIETTLEICQLLAKYGLIYREMDERQKINSKNMEWLNQLISFKNNPILKKQTLSSLKEAFQRLC